MGILSRIRQEYYKLSENKTITQKCNYILASIQFSLKSSYLYSYPIKLTIDPSNYCNLRCELCPSGNKAAGRTRAFMSFDTFKKVVDECGPYLWEIDLFNWGEPLLNKEISKMIEYTTNKKIDVSISTHLNYFNHDICVALIESGLKKIIISLDGASHESVNKYQQGCDFELVLSNMEKIVETKKLLNSTTPFVQWRFLVNRYNEHEIEKAFELSRKLKIDKLELGKFRCDMEKEIFMNREEMLKNLSAWIPQGEEISEYIHVEERDRQNLVCAFLWLESVIQPNGSVSPCCSIWPEKYDFGTINDSPFKVIWNNQKYQNARKMHRGDMISTENRNELICHICKQNEGPLF